MTPHLHGPANPVETRDPTLAITLSTCIVLLAAVTLLPGEVIVLGAWAGLIGLGIVVARRRREATPLLQPSEG